MSEIVIKVENLSKIYRIGELGTGTISHDLNRWWKTKILRKEDPYSKVGTINDRTQKANKDEYVYALKDINFEVKQGEVLGIIGKNGAGKSTLLKVLSRITSPTTGQVLIKGRVASLLEVGTGFHQEMTGRENIYLNGTINGMNRYEISKKLDEIVDFAGVAKYLDTPVKRYSSGMTVRLGFAVAAFLEPEILIVDEVLAVGDAEFQKKAIGKMQEVSQGQGRTVLFVSHNMGSIQTICTKAISLQNGLIYKTGDVNYVIENYLKSDQKQSTFLIDKSNASFIGFAYKICIEDPNNNPIDSIPVGSAWQIRVFFKLVEKCDYFIAALSFKNAYGLVVRTVFSKRQNLKEGDYEIVFKEKEIIYGIGLYNITIGLSSYEKPIHYIENAGAFNITEINSMISNEQIIRLNASSILNPMQYELLKINKK